MLTDSYQGVAFALFLLAAGLAWWARWIARRLRAPRVLRFVPVTIMIGWGVAMLWGWQRLQRVPGAVEAAPASERARALSEGIASAMRPLADLAFGLVATAVD